MLHAFKTDLSLKGAFWGIHGRRLTIWEPWGGLGNSLGVPVYGSLLYEALFRIP